ncbi:glycoside hydrolase family 16 protein [Stachybotrys elegans]|uniref:Glycoside hydrolase family 16 protein n=1 Tax=Stachybotrys elegans TaxID=80388 RepID=A0A8K0T5T4_9HYPO|nr:glycoside hydrolase family 16 protein [Stachybotrys elegans]
MRALTLAHSLSFLLLGNSKLAAAEGDNILRNDSSCDCFLTNGSDPTYYSSHLFFDFRDLAQYAGVPEVIPDAQRSSLAPPTSDYFTSERWTNTWEIQNWNNSQDGYGDATVFMVNSPNNIYIQQDDQDDSLTFLTMRTQRLRGFQTAAEFQTPSQNYQFLSVRMLARTIGSPGAVTALFTYRSAEELTGVQEADIEVLTRDPRDKIQYTNQPSYTEDGDELPDATVNATMPRGTLWSDWAVHRLDWTPDTSVWYVNDHKVAAIKFQTPRDGSTVNLNVWSNGGSWSGNMSLFDAAYMQVQWLEMVFNTTEEGLAQRSIPTDGVPLLSRRQDDEEGCTVVCSIDETPERGVAAMLWDGSESAATHIGILQDRIWALLFGIWLLALAN